MQRTFSPLLRSSWSIPRYFKPLSSVPVRRISSQNMRSSAVAAAQVVEEPQQAQHSGFHVPTIDMAPFLRDPTSRESANIIEQVRSACETSGFFQLTNHGVPVSLQESLFKAAESFFKLPYEEKEKLDCKQRLGHRGYDLLASQSYEPGVLPDLKEGFYIGPDIPATDPRAVARRFYMGPSVWPPSSLLPHSSLKDPAEAYYTAVYNLSLRVLDLIFATLPPSASTKLAEFTDEALVAAPLRLLHYPPAQKTEQRQLGSSAHTDFGAITLLLQDGNPGLEVFDEGTQTWHEIEPTKNAYVVNVGDMLEMWTGGRFKSSLHRVINKKPTDRYSVVFFFDGNLDCGLSPLDGSTAKGEVVTVEQHMIRRLTQSYHGKDPRGPKEGE